MQPEETSLLERLPCYVGIRQECLCYRTAKPEEESKEPAGRPAQLTVNRRYGIVDSPPENTRSISVFALGRARILFESM